MSEIATVATAMRANFEAALAKNEVKRDEFRAMVDAEPDPDTDTAHHYRRVAAMYAEICEIIQHWRDLPPGSARRDAHLLEVAPEMRALLERTLRHFENISGDREDSPFMREIRRTLRRASHL